jgi:two-component system phosphate regulon sensor histidine kinase PhoR
LLSRVEVRLNFLLDLINDLLALAASKSLEAGKSLEPVRVQPLLHRVIDTYSDDAKNKKVELKCSMIDKALRVQAIEKDLDTVLRNLINNAIKYTPQGGSVHVDVTKDNDHARISVKDTGIGISEEDLPHIGEEFFRAKNATTEGIPGTGLGISIVKQLVERMGGQMNVTSSLGNGSTFTVLLRLAHQ